MVIFIAGPSHTGKTKLAQALLEKYHYPYLSMDHLKMGLIRSGHTNLTPMSEEKELIGFLWPIVREMAKTAVENKQNLIIEGCYIPFDWKKDFDRSYLPDMKYICLVMSGNYIRTHFKDIKGYAGVIEQRKDDSDCTMEAVLKDNLEALEMCRRHHADYLFIDTEYDVGLEL